MSTHVSFWPMAPWKDALKDGSEEAQFEDVAGSELDAAADAESVGTATLLTGASVVEDEDGEDEVDEGEDELLLLLVVVVELSVNSDRVKRTPSPLASTMPEPSEGVKSHSDTRHCVATSAMTTRMVWGRIVKEGGGGLG